MSEFTPEDAYKTHRTDAEGVDREPGVAFDDLSDMAIRMYELESDLLNKRLREDEPFAVSFVNECLAGSYDKAGILRWWERTRTSLGGKTPQEMWAEDRSKVIALARNIAGPVNQS